MPGAGTAAGGDRAGLVRGVWQAGGETPVYICPTLVSFQYMHAYPLGASLAEPGTGVAGIPLARMASRNARGGLLRGENTCPTSKTGIPLPR